MADVVQPKVPKLKVVGALAAAAAFIVLTAAPAVAHVTTDPESAPKGAEITLGFRVPNEEDSAKTTTVEVDLPVDHPLLGVLPEPVTGWTAVVHQATLNPPVKTDDGTITQAVDKITWTADSGGGIPVGQFQEFPILVQTLPSDTAQVAFKAIQTYANGDVVRWIDPVVSGQSSPEHPTPILTLGPARASTSTSDSTARTLGIVGLVVGVVGVVLAVLALTRRRATAPPT